jgi:protein tyrosine phosphatase (PTP) superfamily phosphohydrolase (DUF442 family)
MSRFRWPGLARAGAAAGIIGALRLAITSLLAITVLLALSVPVLAQVLLPAPPNVVAITPRLTTSGQPSAAWLETLGTRGVEAVIYLAPLSVGDAVPEEPQILARQKIDFIHIPIAFNRPSNADFDQFSAAMTRFADKNVLVHCQINMRASSMVFLYRTIVGHENPQIAIADVEKVWLPDGIWKNFMQQQLTRHGVSFDLTEDGFR